MIEIVGPQLSQWDVKRSVCITKSDATHIHFANQGDCKAVIMPITEGTSRIPDYLLQTGKTLFAYAVKDGVTLESMSFPVSKRERPEDYVYEEDKRNYIYELITEALAATAAANKAAENANKAAEEATAAAENASKAAENANDAAMNAMYSAVDKLCPGFEESGSVVTCEPVEGYPLEVVTTLPASDDGCTGLTLYRGGKNLSPNVSASMSNTAGSITLADNILTLNSDGSGNSNIAITYRKARAFTLPAGTYRLTAEKISGTAAAFSVVYFGLQDPASSWVVETGLYSVDGNAVKTFTFTEPKTVCVCAIANANQGFDSLTYRIQIEIGKVSTAYEPYRGEVFTADFSNHPNVAALYSCTYNWATGVLVDGDGTEWQHDPDNGEFTMVDEDDQPTVIRNIPALSGVNYLYCDVGTVTVKGRKDPVAIIEKQEARLKALEAAIINNT